VRVGRGNDAQPGRMEETFASRAGTAHEFTGEEARAAGRKGGHASHANRQRTLGEQPVETLK
jgi:hypothetical protein